MMDFWQTRGGVEFTYKLLHQLTRIADGIETQNSLYERLLPPNEENLEPDPSDLAYYIGDCEKCQEDRCEPFIAKAVWLHDDDGNDVMQHCRCSCTCHLEKEIAV
tara:strand:- start:204 stop:518 length:315 start_codon:yes stop_codon:yes gene_type:complete